MPMNPQVLGASFVVATQNTDPIGAALMLATGGPFVLWTLTNVIVSATGGPSPLIAAPPLITGRGSLVVGPSQSLGLLLAATVGATDLASIEKWLAVAAHYAKKLRDEAGIFVVTALVPWLSPLPPAGPVSGVGVGIAFDSPLDFKSALEIDDAVAGAKWDAIGAALELHLKLITITPAMTNLFTGGPVAGVGAIA